MPPPTTITACKEQNRWCCVEDEAHEDTNLPTLKSHDCVQGKALISLGDTDAMMLVFPVEGRRRGLTGHLQEAHTYTNMLFSKDHV